MRRLRLLAALTVLALVHGLALAAEARADLAVVVLDRGVAAEDPTGLLPATATELVETLRELGLETRFYVYGANPGGRIRAAELKGDATKALGRAINREGWQFEGPTDPRHALHTAVRRHRGGEPLLVLLVGPFDGEGLDAGPAIEALHTWNEKAPEGSRVFAVGLTTRRARLVEDAEGWLGAGALVLGVGATEVDARPLSPFGDESATARLRIPLSAVLLGGGGDGPLLDARSALESDVVRVRTDPDGPTLLVDLERPRSNKRTATVSFATPDDPAVVWLVEPPQPKTFQWDTFLLDAGIGCWMTRGGEDSVQGGLRGCYEGRPFGVENGEAGTPTVGDYRITFTRTDTPLDWKARDASGTFPEGLKVEVKAPASFAADLLFTQVLVTFTPRAGRPLKTKGTILLEAAGFDETLKVGYHLHVPPGRLTAHLDAPTEPLRLPVATAAEGASDGGAAWTLRVEPENANVPSHVRVRMTVDPPEAAEALVARVQSPGGVAVTWDLATPIALRTGTRHEFTPELKPGVRGVNATLRLVLPDQAGIEGEARGTGRVVSRAPRIAVAEGPWVYRLEGGEVVGRPPLVLEIDADGGTGAWRNALHEIPPSVASSTGPVPTWTLAPVEPGRWELRPEGEWNGERAGAFAARTDPAEVVFRWAGAQAPPPAVAIPIEVPPRWGAAGWILVALAGMALALAAWGFLQLRAPRVEGTLLYTVEGRERAVGRLDLAPVGRRATVVRADRGGRLHFEGKGDVVASIRPTRVGGLLGVDLDGRLTEHLLVDGLTLTSGRHRLRYVSGRPEDATVPAVVVPGADLLGKEFELEGGRIDALGRKRQSPTESSDPETDDPTAPPARS